MIINSISLLNFRNFSSFELRCHAKLNIIHGVNGSGKTSLLEAIYFLSRGKSPRESNLSNLIKHDQDSFCLRAELQDNDLMLEAGVQRFLDGNKKIKLNGDSCRSMSALTEHLPVLLLDTDSHRQIASGAKYRRSIIDWGAYYKFSNFAKLWRAYNRALSQRNMALKMQQSTKDWDLIMIEHGELLTQQRQEYCDLLIAKFDFYWKLLAPDLPSVEINFFSGFAKQSFKEALDESLHKDRLLGFSKVGPHRADLNYQINGKSAFSVLSQGQQKVMSYALILAQGAVLSQHTKKDCIYIIDDLSAELDNMRCHTIISELMSFQAQVFLTIIDPVAFNSYSKDRFCLFDLSV